MKVDMSPEAITGRMKMLGQLWELSVALKTSEIVTPQTVSTDPVDPSDTENSAAAGSDSKKDDSF